MATGREKQQDVRLPGSGKQNQVLVDMLERGIGSIMPCPRDKENGRGFIPGRPTGCQHHNPVGRG